MNAPLLETRALSRSFGAPADPIPVLNRVDLTLEEGEFVILSGPSGCGKSTLLHLLGLLDEPDSGEIRWQGAETRAWGEKQRSRFRAEQLGFVFQQFHLLPHRSVLDNLLFRMRYSNRTVDPLAANRLLERIGLAHRSRQPARVLSGGEQQRLCIARALLLQPLVLLADEPTGNLGEAHSRVVRELFSELHHQGQAILLATHDTDWLPLADRVLHFRGGRFQS